MVSGVSSCRSNVAKLLFYKIKSSSKESSCMLDITTLQYSLRLLLHILINIKKQLPNLFILTWQYCEVERQLAIECVNKKHL